jgi:hypothetical protein
MSRFEIQFKGRVYVQASNFDDAKFKFLEKYPDPLTIFSFTEMDSYNEKEVIGRCEDSGLPIFEDDDYSSDENGVMWLNVKPTPSGNAV